MRPHLRPAAALLALVLSTGGGLTACGSDGGDAADGTLRVVEVTVDRPVNPRVTAVRLVIDNGSATADALVAADSPVAEEASLHRSGTDADGRSTMEPVDQVEVAPRSKVTFAPGGLHVMLEDLNEDLEVGDKVPLTFTFTEAGTVSVEGIVTEPGAAAEEHDDHD